MRTKEFSIVALAVLPLIWFSSCGQTSEPEVVTASNISSEAVEDLLSSAFVVEGLACQRKSIGSGIAVEAGILTNAHVVAGTDDLHVIDRNGDQYLAKIEASGTLLFYTVCQISRKICLSYWARKRR